MPSLLPNTVQNNGTNSNDMEISSLVQISAFAGFGLLFCESCNRQIIEFLLSELYKPVTTNTIDAREALSLTTSWALGMVLLGKGNNYKNPISESEMQNLLPEESFSSPISSINGKT